MAKKLFFLNIKNIHILLLHVLKCSISIENMFQNSLMSVHNNYSVIYHCNDCFPRFWSETHGKLSLSKQEKGKSQENRRSVL